jgi:ParB family chromosome partitioning protein
LPEEIQAMVHQGDLSEGHGRALLGVGNPERMLKLARDAATEGWSVRETEATVAGQRDAAAAAPGRTVTRKSQRLTTPADAKRIEDALRKHLGTDVRVTSRRRGRGFLTISYYSNDDLARVLELILGAPYQG